MCNVIMAYLTYLDESNKIKVFLFWVVSVYVQNLYTDNHKAQLWRRH